MFIIEGIFVSFFWQKINIGMLRMDVFGDFSLIIEVFLFFVRIFCINCYGGRVIFYVVIFIGMFEVRCQGCKQLFYVVGSFGICFY